MSQRWRLHETNAAARESTRFRDGVVPAQATWQKVNRDFGSIFSSLLPGAHAKLEPPEGATSVLDGLEVKVGFGGLWKESLSVWNQLVLTPSTRRRLDGVPVGVSHGHSTRLTG